MRPIRFASDIRYTAFGLLTSRCATVLHAIGTHEYSPAVPGEKSFFPPSPEIPTARPVS